MGLVIKSKDGTAAPKSLPAPQAAEPNQFEAHVQSAPVLGTVHITKEKGKKGHKTEMTVKDENHVVHKGIMADPSTIVRLGIEASHTVNLGNFESAKIGVSINLPCTKDDIEETYQFGLNWVSGKIEEAISDSKN